MPPPRKKDRLRGSLSPVREQFPPTGTLCGGQAELPGKSCPDEGAKQPPARARNCVQTAPTEERRAMGCLVPGKHRTGHPPGQRACPGAKTAPAEAGSCAQAAPMGERRASCVGWCLESTALGARWDRGTPGRKTAPGGAGGCLDAGYGCYYLPRAIRVIWMHRVGSTARPRIMPS